MAARNTTDLFPIVIRHLSDTATVHTLYGCLGGSQKAGDFFLETLTENKGDGRFKQLNEQQNATIDSLLFFGDNNRLQARDELLAKIQPSEKYYGRVKQIVFAENNKIALVALAKYRKQQDKPLIAKLLQEENNQIYGFAAVVNFPDRSFFPVLQQTLRNEVTKDNGGNDRRLQLLYQAIVQYKDQTSRQLLQSVLKEAKGIQAIYHSDYLHQALKKYPLQSLRDYLNPFMQSPRQKPAAHNSSFAIGWQTEEQSAANQYSTAVTSKML